MGSKILEFLGLSGHSDDVVVDSRRRNRRDAYMKKFHRLVIPEDDEVIPEGEEDQPIRGYVAVKDDPLTEELHVASESAETVPEQEQEQSEEKLSDTSVVEKPEKYDEQGEQTVDERTFSSKLRNFGESLRRPKNSTQPLVIVKKGASEMLDDIEEALLDGQTVLLDFEKENRQTATEVVTRIVNFVRVHNGVFYTITSTSLLLSLEKNSVIEWLPENDASEQ